MPELRFPLYALADAQTTETVYRGNWQDRRLLLFTTAEKASRYRSRLQLVASVVKLKEPKDVRDLLAMQTEVRNFSVELDPDDE